MKIAFLLTQLEAGGAQTRVFQTARELRARGHNVDVYFYYTKRECFHEEEKLVLSTRKGGRSLIDALPKLYRALKSGGYDAFISNTSPANIFGNPIAALAGITNRTAWQTQPPQRLPVAYRALDFLAGILPVYKRIVANSGWTFSCFSGYPSIYKKKLTTIKNGVGSRALSLSKEDARQQLGLEVGDFIFCTVGRLSVQKGQDTLIRALSQVPSVRLLLIGSGELRDQLGELAAAQGVADRVSFCGEVSGNDVSRYLHAADAFVFPSRWETFGLAVVEAASVGLPIIASDIPVLREVLYNGDEPCATFVPVDQPELWASQMARLAGASSDERLAQSRLSRTYAESHSVERHVDQLLALIG